MMCGMCDVASSMVDVVCSLRGVSASPVAVRGGQRHQPSAASSLVTRRLVAEEDSTLRDYSAIFSPLAGC